MIFTFLYSIRYTYNTLILEVLSHLTPNESDMKQKIESDMKQIIFTTRGIALPEHIEAQALQSVVVLLVTANTIETSAIHDLLNPLDGHEYIYRFSKDVGETKAYYYIGKYGDCPTAIRKVNGSAMEVSKMANECFPNLNVIISIDTAACKNNEVKINIHDFLVSDDSAVKIGEKTIMISAELIRLFSPLEKFQWPNDDKQEKLVNPNVKSSAIVSLTISLCNNSMDNSSKEIDIIKVEPTTEFFAIVNDCEKGKEDKNQSNTAKLAARLIHKSLSHHKVHEIIVNKSTYVRKYNTLDVSINFLVSYVCIYFIYMYTHVHVKEFPSTVTYVVMYINAYLHS